MEKTNELMVLDADEKTLIKQVEQFKIEGADGLTTAAHFLKKAKDSIKALKEKIKDETEGLKERIDLLKEEIQKISEPYLVAIEAMQAVEKRMNQLTTNYYAELDAARIKAQIEADKIHAKEQEKENKIAERTGSAPVFLPQTKIEAPSLKGTGIAVKSYQTYSIPGIVSNGEILGNPDLSRCNKKLQEIPDEYWILDLKKIGNAHKMASCKIPGTVHSVKRSAAGTNTKGR